MSLARQLAELATERFVLGGFGWEIHRVRSSDLAAVGHAELVGASDARVALDQLRRENAAADGAPDRSEAKLQALAAYVESSPKRLQAWAERLDAYFCAGVRRLAIPNDPAPAPPIAPTPPGPRPLPPEDPTDVEIAEYDERIEDWECLDAEHKLHVEAWPLACETYRAAAATWEAAALARLAPVRFVREDPGVGDAEDAPVWCGEIPDEVRHAVATRVLALGGGPAAVRPFRGGA